MNNTHVTTALEHVAAVEAARVHLAELHDRQARLSPQDRVRQDGVGRQIASQYDAIRTGTRLAEASAAIAQAVALERIAAALERAHPAAVVKRGKAVTL